MLRSVTLCAVALLSTIALESVASAQAAPSDPAAAPAPVAAPAPDAPPAPPAPPAPAAPEPLPPPAAAPAEAPAPDAVPATTFESLKVESKNGSASLKVGLLLQPQYEAIGSAFATHKGTSSNLFLRRTRLLVGGTLFKNFEYFFDTDAPNLGRGDTTIEDGAMPPANGTGQKTGAGMFVQDAYATWKAADDMLKFDGGYMLPPGAHNALQGAGTLLGVDYFSNSFNHTGAFNAATAPVGRDTGIEARGLLVDNHIEYRAGLFQGLRKPGTDGTAAAPGDVASQNMFRFAGRIQVNILDAETGFFYAGTYLGKKQILSIGASIDAQSKYMHWAFDGFLDMPAGPGTVTAQVNYAKWNGGTFIPALTNESAIMAEAGYRFDAFPIAPIAKFELLSQKNSDAKNTRIGGGLAYFPYGHNINLKAFLTNINAKSAEDVSHSYNQFQLQGQLYFY
jgi:hypothetical protein